MTKRMMLRTTAMVVFSMILAAGAGAQELPAPEVDIAVSRTLSAGADEPGQDWEVAETRIEADFKYPVVITPENILELAAKGEFISFDWDRPGNISLAGGTEPWDDLSWAEIDLNHSLKLADPFSMVLGGFVGAGFEDGIDDAFTFGGYVAAVVSQGPVHFFAGGGFLQFPDRGEGIPIFGMAFNQDPFQPGEAPFSFSIGFPKTEIHFAVNEILSFGGYAEGEWRTFRLRDDSPVSPEGQLEMKGYKAGVEVSAALMDYAEFTLGAFYQFAREWEFMNEAGDSLGKAVDLDEALGFSFAVKAAF